MCEGRLSLNVGRRSSLLKNAYSNQGVLDENALRDTPRERSLRNKGDRHSAQEVEFMNLDSLEIASLPNRKARTECAIPTSIIITSTAKRSQDGLHSQRCSATSVAKGLVTAVPITEMAQESNKTPDTTSESPEVNARPIVHRGLDDRLSDRLPPGYTEFLLGSDDVIRFWVPNCHQELCSCKLRTNEKYEHVNRFCACFSFYLLHSANILFSKQSLLFLRFIV